MRQLVVISGRICTGKSGLARRLAKEYGYHILKTSRAIERLSDSNERGLSRPSLQSLGDIKDKETNSAWINDAVRQECQKLPSARTPVVIDHIRVKEQLLRLRADNEFEVVHVHLWGPMATLKERFEAKQKSGKIDADQTFEGADALKNDEDVEFFKSDADVRINTARTDGRDTFVRVAARLGLFSPPNIRCVDVLVGGQYGSEGKGHIAAYLARQYDVLIRVGGPNAGHTVSNSSGIYTYHQLPSGAKDTGAELLLGPGMTIDVDGLLKEIKDCNITPERLFIDPQAIIIEDFDKEQEADIKKKIASTGRGSGAASARRILERGEPRTRLAKDIPELRPFVGEERPYRGSTQARLEKAYQEGCSILLEGTQGSGLSIYHGSYPHVTSRDTNVAGCIAEAGISPSRIRRILMVVRTTPIRVGNPEGNDGFTSGPLKHETSFEKIAKFASLEPTELLQNERTSTTNRSRRVGWFEWDQFRTACAINAPTDIVLTFVDYLSSANSKARRFEQLDDNTIKFIEELERVSQAPVSLINTRFPRNSEERIDFRSVIDRRNWKTDRRRKP